jgi:hypothetical protein
MDTDVEPRTAPGQNASREKTLDSVSQEKGELEMLRGYVAELEGTLTKLRALQRHRQSIAADVHRSLPPSPIRHDRIWIDVRYCPSEDVGGDHLHGLSDIARACKDCDLFAVADNLQARISDFQHGPSTDDQTLIIAEMQ